MKKYWIGVFGQTTALLKRISRDKMALFFTFLFPLLFLFIFGSVFSNDSSDLKVAVFNHSPTALAKSFVKILKEGKNTGIKVVSQVSTVDKSHSDDDLTMAQAKEKMKRSSIDGIVELPSDFGKTKGQGATARPAGKINILYAKGSDQAGSTLRAIISQMVYGINQKMGQPEPPLTVSAEAIGDKALKSFDYIFTGLLAFSLLSMGIFGIANQMPSEKQRGAYRRLIAAPFTPGQLIIATAISYVMVTLISAAMMIAIGVGLFHFSMRGNWLLLAGLLVLSAIMVTGIGLMIGAWARNERQSASLSNVISFPVMFLSGTFFPTFLMPAWLQSVGKFVPLTPVADSLRLVAAEHAGLIDVLPQIGMIAIWTIIVYTLAIKLFRWE